MMFGLGYLDLTWPTPEENLACDEALLDWCDAGQGPGVLRFWESTQCFVVVGYANHVQAEVQVEACRDQGVPILRRCSGGGTVLQGPGCLNYSLVLDINADARLYSITQTNRWIMEHHRNELAARLGQTVQVQGHTDLTLGPCKFSGNAQRRKRRAVLFHGTFLLHFELGLIERFLRLPKLQPVYRQGRPHEEFLTNVPLSSSAVKEVLRKTWNAMQTLHEMPRGAIEQLAREKYATAEWNLKW
jgi:lipoate---protein ligase